MITWANFQHSSSNHEISGHAPFFSQWPITLKKQHISLSLGKIDYKLYNIYYSYIDYLQLLFLHAYQNINLHMGHAHFYGNLALFCIKFPINLSFTATNKSRTNIIIYQIKAKDIQFSKKYDNLGKFSAFQFKSRDF